MTSSSTQVLSAPLSSLRETKAPDSFPQGNRPSSLTLVVSHRTQDTALASINQAICEHFDKQALPVDNMVRFSAEPAWKLRKKITPAAHAEEAETQNRIANLVLLLQNRLLVATLLHDTLTYDPRLQVDSITFDPGPSPLILEMRARSSAAGENELQDASAFHRLRAEGPILTMADSANGLSGRLIGQLGTLVGSEAEMANQYARTCGFELGNALAQFLQLEKFAQAHASHYRVVEIFANANPMSLDHSMYSYYHSADGTPKPVSDFERHTVNPQWSDTPFSTSDIELISKLVYV